MNRLKQFLNPIEYCFLGGSFLSNDYQWSHNDLVVLEIAGEIRWKSNGSKLNEVVFEQSGNASLIGFDPITCERVPRPALHIVFECMAVKGLKV